MKPTALIATISLLVAASLAAGYWWGANRPAVQTPAEAKAAPAASAAAPAATGKPRVLYYRNPMGLPDTSPVPKKDPMGMAYIPVYADEKDDAGTVS
jgi:Cu(I)/Ag(I) efflux system membrane fusion protein